MESNGQGAEQAAPDDLIYETFQFVAPQEVPSLGWRLSTMTTYSGGSAWIVTELLESGWAELNGVMQADEIVEINTQGVNNYDETQLRDALKVRPLTIRIRRPLPIQAWRHRYWRH